ncbi:ABC transporter ATP-binding protein/permease [Thomasclavelia spiroformis DSM 1552]|uniref:ABC transporter transmembrane region n=1 Tax=Thomasclavelia spiroformis DSM 1552 TaxID=428126 RepID=B1C1Q8_9FIRM|nr:ABC transporter ATP-binding protein [Thomasclavelia spiroformis]EDS74850.1 ABC transporter transmembrane region [Thomasclavelia spiroformis DSM 1552]UWO88626.1 ABC transporter ATP-binding protein/permease [Thomasclavelia spiroformis DSM 1552]
MSNNQRRNGPKFNPGMHGMRGGGEKAKDFKGTIAKLFRYLKPYYFKLVIVIIFAAASTVFSIVGPKILAKATDKLSEGIMAKVSGTGGIDFEYIGYIIWILVGLYLVSALFSYIQGFITSTISQRVAYDLRTSISKKMDRMPLSYFDRHTSGDILSRVTNDIDTIAQSLNQSMSQVITSSVTVVGIFIMMLSISPQMTIIAVCVLPVSMLLISIVMKRSQKYFAKQQQALGDVNGHIEEMYGGHNVVKAFNGEEASVKQFDEYNDSLYESAWKSQFFSGLMQPITNFVGNVGYVAVCLLGGVLAGGGNISIGDIQAFIQYVRQFNQPISQLAQTMNMLQSTAAAAERVFEFLDEEELEKETPKITKDELEKIKGSVTFADVNFGYLEDQTIINDFSLHVHSGQTVAIVGPTGAGKTTIVKLLMRFYELNGGTIFIDGKDIRDFARKDLRSLFGMVLQDTWLFNGTIKENLMYSKLDASDQEVQEACKVAYVDHFVQTLEDGYDTVINEESSNISQGQKQLLTIARAFLKDPKILILDEATSSVDTRTEVLIQKGMERLMEGRTSFVIAHRLSTIRDADTIIVMKDGDIVELGNHESLLEKDGFYASLYRSQFEGLDN